MYAIVDMVCRIEDKFVHCPPQPKSDLTASAASNGELGYAEALRRELGIRQHDQERSRASGRANSIVRQDLGIALQRIDGSHIRAYGARPYAWSASAAACSA